VRERRKRFIIEIVIIVETIGEKIDSTLPAQSIIIPLPSPPSSPPSTKSMSRLSSFSLRLRSALRFFREIGLLSAMFAISSGVKSRFIAAVLDL
jgi:hypothetical protein